MTGGWSGGCIGDLILLEGATDLALLLIAAAFVAGLVDAIAGGGGLITVPARVIKPLLVVTSAGMALRSLFQAFS